MSDPKFFRNYIDIINEQNPQTMGMDPVKGIEMQLTQAREQKKQIDDQIRQLTTALSQAKAAQTQQRNQPTQQPQTQQTNNQTNQTPVTGTMPGMNNLTQ